MKIAKIICLLLIASSLVLSPLSLALAQEEELKETIEVAPTFPKMEGIAGESFEFEVKLIYIGTKPRVFDLRATSPKGWQVFMTPPFEKEKRISSMRLEPTFSAGERIRLVATAPFLPLPDPGEYKITLEAVSGNVRASTELTAVVTARYNLQSVPAIEGRYNTTATAGKDNTFSMELLNVSTGAIDNINLSSTKPEGWTIEFLPDDKVEKLEALDTKTIDVKITPPAQTIAGDYQITLRASGTQYTAQDLNIRVTVETPTIWGWVGVGIILVVIIGLIIIFVQFSRR